MKIQGPNAANINAYRNQLNNQSTKQKHNELKDQLNISKEAKALQQTNQTTKERSAYIQDIKKLVDSGEYDVNHDELAKKMIDFWSNRT